MLNPLSALQHYYFPSNVQNFLGVSVAYSISITYTTAYYGWHSWKFLPGSFLQEHLHKLHFLNGTKQTKMNIVKSKFSSLR